MTPSDLRCKGVLLMDSSAVPWSAPLTYWTAIDYCSSTAPPHNCRPMHDCVGVIIGGVQHTDGPLQVKYWVENDRFKIYDRCPMTDVAMAISTDADTDADVAYLDHLVTS